MLVLCGCSSKHTVMNEEADSEDVYDDYVFRNQI